jgi:hypothetical protein
MKTGPRIRRRWLIAVCTGAAIVAAYLVLGSQDAFLMLPAILMLSALAHGAFLGEELIARLGARRRSRRARRAPVIAVPRAVRIVCGVGRTIAFALAMRPPPARALLLA